MKAERGFALILVVWSLVLLAGMAAGFSMAVRHEARIAFDDLAELKAEAAKLAAVNQTLFALNDTDLDTRWRADGRIHELAWDDMALRVRVRPESSKVDINRAPPELLAGLFAAMLPDAPTDALVDALADWRDQDDRARTEGAEARDYAAAGYRYGPSNAPFQSVFELAQVIGFDNTTVTALAPYLTVFSRHPRVNAIGADLLTLRAIPGISESDVSQFIAQRDQAIAEGKNVELSPLRNGMRYLESNMNDRVIAMDIEIQLPNAPPISEQLVLQRGRNRLYEILARDTRQSTSGSAL